MLLHVTYFLKVKGTQEPGLTYRIACRIYVFKYSSKKKKTLTLVCDIVKTAFFYEF